jgi:hypothetical protein
MGEIIHAEKSFRERQIDKLIRGLADLYDDATDNWTTFAVLAGKNLPEAIKRLPEFIKRARDTNPNRAFVEAVAGGPNQDWIVPLMNVLGECYESLERNEREQIVRHCLNYFGGLNYLYSQNHVEMLTSPLLITDILMSRWLYWPGLSKQRAFLGNPTVDDMVSKDQETMGSFWVCLAIIWNDDSITLPVRQWYYKNYPDIVEKTLSFAAAHTYFCAKGKVQNGEDIGLHINSFLNTVYDPVLHKRIREKIKESSWIQIQ